jgi:pyruvate dehydrogenase E2 component (dihydrolipoamide acetyltransferase)
MPGEATRTGPPSIRRARSQTVRLGDGRHICVRTRPGDGPPIVLLHGLLDSANGWERFACATSRPCIAFDLPGFGHSDRATRPRISAYALDVGETLDKLDVKSYHLVGHSLGGAIAPALAELAPRRALSLTLLAPAGFGRIHLAEAISIPGIRNLAAAVLPLALSNPLVLTVAYTGVVTSGQAPDPEMLRRVMRSAFDAVPGARDATQAVVAAGLSKRAFYRRSLAYEGPVRAVWGENDRLVPHSHAAGLRTALPQAKIEVWPGMGHHPQRERPAELAELIESACREARTTSRRSPGSSLRQAADGRSPAAA